MKLGEFYKFYPGSTWIKRTGFLLLTCTVGANIFLNEVQELLLIKSEEILTDAQLLTKPVAVEAEKIKQNVVPILRWIEYLNYGPTIEEGVERFFGVKLGIPRSETVVTTMNKVQEFDRKLTKHTPLFQLAAQVIRWTSILIWLPVLFIALPWLMLDLLLGEARERRFTFYSLLIAVPINVGIYHLMRYMTSDYILS